MCEHVRVRGRVCAFRHVSHVSIPENRTLTKGTESFSGDDARTALLTFVVPCDPAAIPALASALPRVS